MRFDDMLATLLAQPRDSDDARVALWRQLVDLLAQGRFTEDEALGESALDCITELRSRVPAEIRAETARAFAGCPVSVAVVALFADEPAPIVSLVIGQAVLDADQWIALLPRLTPTARALLRHRRDLPADVRRALDSFGPSDFVLSSDIPLEDVVDEEESAAVAQPVPDETIEIPIAAVAAAASVPLKTPSRSASTDFDPGSQIRELVERIEAYRSHDFIRPAPPRSPEAPADHDDEDEQDEHGFRFETGASGTIRWVSGVKRGQLIGVTIAVAGRNGDEGVDNHVAGAFRQRAPFRDARMTLGGEGLAAGEWRISAVPVFDDIDGHFCGYRGSARRPRIDEIAAPLVRGGFHTDAASDSMRQLVHELRTPLNAIIGFSEMIEGQLLGPASSRYRDKASDISAQGRRLLTALEDLDLTARLDVTPGDEMLVNPAALIERLHSEYLPFAEERGFKLNFRVATGIGDVAAAPVAVERMFGRLLAATLAVAQRGESIVVDLRVDPRNAQRLQLAVARPGILAGRDERTLLDPGYNPDGDWPDAPVLGLGFALRLVRNIAIACGGALDIETEKLILRLPLRKQVARRGKA